MKRRLRGRKKDNLQEVLMLALNQRRHDDAGNRIQDHTFDEILAMTPAERAALRRAGWPSGQNGDNETI
jgi:hypothetical protein